MRNIGAAAGDNLPCLLSIVEHVWKHNGNIKYCTLQDLRPQDPPRRAVLDKYRVTDGLLGLRLISSIGPRIAVVAITRTSPGFASPTFGAGAPRCAFIELPWASRIAIPTPIAARAAAVG